jgi:hypothetical protein
LCPWNRDTEAAIRRAAKWHTLKFNSVMVATSLMNLPIIYGHARKGDITA